MGIISPPGVSRNAVRVRLNATRQLWVDPVSGLDTNTGLAQASALRTLQTAIDIASNNYDWAGQVVQILVLPGTHAGVTVRGGVGAGTFQLFGFGGTLGDGACKIVGANKNAIYATDGARVQVIGNIQISTTTAGAGIAAAFGSHVTFGNGVQFAACVGEHMVATKGSSITSAGNYWIDGSALCHVHGTAGGIIDHQNSVVTIRNTPAFSAYFAGVDFSIYNCVGTVWSGSATGSRCTVHLNGVIRRGTDNPNDLPGNSAGLIRWGGRFDSLAS